MMVRAGGLEPPQVSRPYGFSYHFGFRRRAGPAGAVRGLDYPFALSATLRGRSGRRRCPSSLYTFRRSARPLRLGSGSPGRGFPEFEQFCIAGFPASTRCRNLAFPLQVRCVYQFRHARSVAAGCIERDWPGWKRFAFSRRIRAHSADSRPQRRGASNRACRRRSDRSDVEAEPHFLTWLEIWHPLGRNGHSVASPRITSNTRATATRRKGAEATKFYTAAFCEPLCNRVEQCRNDLFDFFRRKIGIVLRQQLYQLGSDHKATPVDVMPEPVNAPSADLAPSSTRADPF